MVSNWIEQEDINNFSDSITLMPPETHAIYEELVETFNEYGIYTDLATFYATNEIEYLTEQIHSDIKCRDLLVSKMANLSDVNKLNRICALVDESEQFLVKFNANIDNCMNKYRDFVVPKLPKFVKQLKKLSSDHNNAILGESDTETAINDIQTLITLMQSEIKDIEARSDKAIDVFRKCIASSGTECEQHFNEMHKKFQTVLN